MAGARRRELTDGQHGTINAAAFRARVAATMTEADLQRVVLDAAKVYGWRAYHTFDSRRSHAGFPDLILVKPPLLLAIELKSSKGKVRPEQADWLRDLGQVRDVRAAVIRPADIDAVLEVLAGQPITG